MKSIIQYLNESEKEKKSKVKTWHRVALPLGLAGIVAASVGSRAGIYSKLQKEIGAIRGNNQQNK